VNIEDDLKCRLFSGGNFENIPNRPLFVRFQNSTTSLFLYDFGYIKPQYTRVITLSFNTVELSPFYFNNNFLYFERKTTRATTTFTRYNAYTLSPINSFIW